MGSRASPQESRAASRRGPCPQGHAQTAGLVDETARRGRGCPAARPPPLENSPSRQQLRGAVPVWVRPELVVEVELRGYTEDGLLRQASLKGLRRDRSVESLRAAARDVAVITRDAG